MCLSEVHAHAELILPPTAINRSDFRLASGAPHAQTSPLLPGSFVLPTFDDFTSPPQSFVVLLESFHLTQTIHTFTSVVFLFFFHLNGKTDRVALLL